MLTENEELINRKGKGDLENSIEVKNLTSDFDIYEEPRLGNDDYKSDLRGGSIGDVAYDVLGSTKCRDCSSGKCQSSTSNCNSSLQEEG